jgi:hypothetical protein
MPPQPKNKNHSAFAAWGYWAGGIFCFIGLLALSLGFVPILKSIRKKPVLLQLPGEQTVDLRLPGAYIAISAAQDFSPENQRLIGDLEYSLRPKKNPKDAIRIVKIPARQFVSDKAEMQVPLFQFAIDDADTYVFNSEYPYGIDGPKIAAD